MARQNVVSREEWLEARKAHLANEKAFTLKRDALTEERRNLPWVRVDKDYVFDTPDGQQSLQDLFAGKKQLLVYHFMFGPDWEEGCPSCSFWADNFNGIDVHLAHRDISLMFIANTSVDKFGRYHQRMGWSFRWASSINNDFNRDYHVSFSEEELESGNMYYNYRKTRFPSTEAPGISVFYQDDDGGVYHTYSCYARGLDMLNGAYHLIDLTPIGRNEAQGNMYWLRRRDQYED